MKVYLGPYRRWWGPYQLADKIPFISEETSEKIGDWLAQTWVNDLCNWIHSKRDRKISIRIDKYDTWSMDNTLSLIILPMLKQLQATKQGSQLVDNEDVPPHMRYDGENWIHYKWEWILKELIWTFEQLVDDSWEDQYTIQEGELDFDEHPEDEGKEFTPVRWKKEYIINYEGFKAHQERINNGLRLFGKYYQGLWD